MKGDHNASLHEGVLDRLGALIVTGELTSGEVLRTEEIESRFGVSRSVAREAIRVLESIGLVSSRRRVGVTVQPRESWHVFDRQVIRWRLGSADRLKQLESLSALRTGIEPVAAELAATHATPEQCGRLQGAVMQMAVHAKSGDLDAYLEADIDFHQTMLVASGNEMLAALGSVVAEVLTGRTQHDLMPETPNPIAIRLHGDVAQAIQSGEGTAAAASMREIIAEAQGALPKPD